jgi:hypothetical protein
MAKRKKPDDRQTPQVYAAASLTNNDLLSSRYMVQSADVELVGRMIRNTVARAIDLNATVVSSQPLRLYRPSSGSKVYGKRRVDRRTKAFLSGRGVNKPHKKAVSVSSASDEMEEITSHPILDLLYAPDPSMTCGQWFYLIQSYIEATGWCAAWMGPDQIPKGMYVLAPHQTKIDFTVQDYIRGFTFGAETSKERFFPYEECAYFRLRPHPQNPNRAASWVSSVIMPSDMEQAALQSEIARWNNGGLPGAVFKINATSQTEFDRAANEIDRQTRGVNKAGRNLIISNAEVIQPASKPHEMNYQAGLDTAEARIYRAAGIPEPLWKLNDANLASASAASPAYMNLTIWPRLSTLAEILTEYVVSRFDPTGTMFLAFDNPDNEDVTQETARMVSLANAGLVSANEARAALGIEQAGPELDVYRFNGVPIMVPAMDRVPVPEEADDEATEAPEERDEQEDTAPEASDEPEGSDGDGADDAGEGNEATAAKSNDLRSDGTGGDALARHGDGLPGRSGAAQSKLTCTCDNHTKEAELARRPDGMNTAIDQMADDMARWYQTTLAAGITESGLVVSTQALAELDRVLDDGLARMYRQGYADTVQAMPDADGVMPTFDINDRARQYLMETKLELVRTIP